MSSNRIHPELVQRLGARLAHQLARAADRARKLHAEALYPEHLLLACMEDGESAAREVIQGAFADPDTLAGEILAISPGLSVVGAWGAVPFSPGALRAMRATYASLLASPDGPVSPGAPGSSEGEEAVILAACPLARAARRELQPEIRVLLEEHISASAEPDPAPASPAAADRIDTADVEAEVDGGRMFRSLDDGCRRLLVAAGRLALDLGDGALGPAHLYLAHLAADAAFSRSEGVTAMGARSLLSGHTRDPRPLEPRTIPPADELVPFLDRLPDGADSLSVLTACHGPEGGELGPLLTRHRIGLTLLEAARPRHRDPEPAPPPENPGQTPQPSR